MANVFFTHGTHAWQLHYLYHKNILIWARRKDRNSSLFHSKILSNSRKKLCEKVLLTLRTLTVNYPLQTLHGHQKKIYETGKCCQHPRGELFSLLVYVQCKASELVCFSYLKSNSDTPWLINCIDMKQNVFI